MTIYYVISQCGTREAARFTHYGRAVSFARQIGYRVVPIRTKNPLKYLMAVI